MVRMCGQMGIRVIVRRFGIWMLDGEVCRRCLLCVFTTEYNFECILSNYRGQNHMCINLPGFIPAKWVEFFWRVIKKK